MKILNTFGCNFFVITPAALAVGEHPPASIHDQKWLLVLSGVVIADLQGNSEAQWLREIVSFTPDVSGPFGPLSWAITRFSIPTPPGQFGLDYDVAFPLEEWVPFATLSSIFNQGPSINSGFAVDRWRASDFASGTDILSGLPVNNIFTGINVDLAVRDTDAIIYRLGYNITLLGKIAFLPHVIL
jgi:hypothetical protein